MFLTIRGGEGLRLVHVIEKILGKEGLCKLGFDIPRGKLTAQQAMMPNRVEEELPCASDVAKADDIDYQEIMKNVARGMKDVTANPSKPNEKCFLDLRNIFSNQENIRKFFSKQEVYLAKKTFLVPSIRMFILI